MGSQSTDFTISPMRAVRIHYDPDKVRAWPENYPLQGRVGIVWFAPVAGQTAPRPNRGWWETWDSATGQTVATRTPLAVSDLDTGCWFLTVDGRRVELAPAPSTERPTSRNHVVMLAGADIGGRLVTVPFGNLQVIGEERAAAPRREPREAAPRPRPAQVEAPATGALL